MKERMERWIAQSAPRWMIVAVYFILDKLNIIAKKKRESHRIYNLGILDEADSVLEKGYINNQNSWDRVKFGKTTMAFSGCEIMATYNILKSCKGEGGSRFMSGLIADFERKGAALKGLIGSSPIAVRKYLKNNNIQTRLIWKNEDVSESTKKLIITFFNNKETVRDMIHTVAVINDGDGYRIYNAGVNKCFESISEALLNVAKNPKTICILEVIEEK